MSSINMSIRTDSELKAQAEAVLSQLGMNMNGTINMFLHQIVRDKAVPLSLSLSSEQAVYADLLAAQAERKNGYVGRNARDVLAEMDQIIADTEVARGTSAFWPTSVCRPPSAFAKSMLRFWIVWRRTRFSFR